VTGSPEVTSRVADFAASARLGQLPESVAIAAYDLVRGGLTAGIRGAATAEADVLHGFLTWLDESTDAPQPAGPTLGAVGPLSRSAAVMFNAACMELGSTEPSAPCVRMLPRSAVVASVFAAAQLPKATGGSMLEGVAVGAETGLRVARALQHRGLPSGWSLAGIAGRIAAATAVVKALGGGEPEISAAIGLAATQAAGLEAPAPPVAAGMLTGKAATDGWEAGLLSLTEWKGPDRPLEGNHGLFRLITGEAAAQEVVTGLGDDWILIQVTLDGFAAEQVHRPLGGLASTAADSFIRCIESAATSELTRLAERRRSQKRS